jgi:hypothetical protein
MRKKRSVGKPHNHHWRHVTCFWSRLIDSQLIYLLTEWFIYKHGWLTCICEGDEVIPL